MHLEVTLSWNPNTLSSHRGDNEASSCPPLQHSILVICYCMRHTRAVQMFSRYFLHSLLKGPTSRRAMGEGHYTLAEVIHPLKPP